MYDYALYYEENGKDKKCNLQKTKIKKKSPT